MRRAVLVAAFLLAGCPQTVPAPVPATRLASAVESELEAAGCAPDGGLGALEREHARFDRPAWVDCMFRLDGDVKTCGACP